MDWLFTKIIEWWAHPRITAKLEVILVFAGAASLLGAGLLKFYRAVRWCIRWCWDWHRRQPLEGLTAGEPLATPHFTGREEERKLLATLIENQHVCAVEGPPLIGKSWLISEVIKSDGLQDRCIFIELKRKSGLSALLFAINAGLVRLGCHDFDGVCRRDDLTPDQKAQELRPLLVAGKWLIVLDAYERVEAGGEIDQTIENWSKGIGTSHVVLGSRRNPSWLAAGAFLDMPAMAAEQMNTLSRRLGLTQAEAGEVCGKLAGLPGAAGLFRGILEQKGAAAARKLVGKKAEKLGRTLFDAAFSAAPQAARDVWMVASWFPQPLTREAVFAICGEDAFKEGVSLLERWTVLTEGSERLDLHAWATRTGKSALRWMALPWRGSKRRTWGRQAARVYVVLAGAKRDDRDAIEAELENVLAAARLAFEYREWEALWGMGYALDDPLDYAGRWTAREELLRLCAEGGRKSGDKRARAAFTQNLGIMLQQRGRLEEAEALYRESLTLRRELGNRQLEAQTLHQLGRMAELRGNLDQAEDWYNQSLEIEREVGDRPGEARTLHQLGRVAEDRGKLEEAEDFYRQSLEIEREVGDRPGEAKTRHALAMVAQRRGDLERAAAECEECLHLYRDLGMRPEEAMALHMKGMLAQERGRLEEAEDWYKRSLAIEREVGDRPSEARTLHQLGMVAQWREKLEEAEDLYQQSLEIEREVGNRRGVAQSLHQLGMLAQGRGKLEEAEDFYKQSLEIKREVGDRRGEAQTLAQMALLAEEQGDVGLAVERMEQAVGMMEGMGLGEAGRAGGELERLRKRLEEEQGGPKS